MKTRRSLQLEKVPLNACMQSVLFPLKKNRKRSGIVPETPGNYNTSVKSTFTSTTASVLETPDDVQKTDAEISKNKKINSTNISKKKQAEEACSTTRKCHEESDDAFIFNATPNVRVNKREGITSILEAEYSFANKETEDSSVLPFIREELNEPVRRNKRHSLAETILPFDFNNKKVIAKKLSNINISAAKRKSLALNHGKEEGICRSSAVKNLKPHTYRLASNTRHKSGQFCTKDMSLDNSLSNESNATSNTKLRASKNITKVSFENSSIDLTNTNSGSDILLGDQAVTALQLSHSIPCLNFSSTDDEVEDLCSKLNNTNGTVGTHTVTQEKLDVPFKSLSYNNHEKEIQNKKTSSWFIENSSPMSNYQRKIIEGELSPLNRSIFNAQDSLTPTQPATVLILQGIVAFVDVRSGAENRSIVFKEVLSSLGAQVYEKFTSEVTHVIFRDGSRSTYQRSIQRGVHLISPLWVDACRVKCVRVSESLFPISADYTSKKTSVLGKPTIPRKMKSMQPRDFEEDVLVAELRMKRKQRLLSNVSSNSEEPSTPLTKTSSLSEDVSSPLFGIAHLLTPTRRKEGRESLSSISSEKSSTEKEFSTPLATRMYNRLLTPISDSPRSPRKIVCPFSAPLAKDEETRTQRLASKATTVSLRRKSKRLAQQKLTSKSSSSEDGELGMTSTLANLKESSTGGASKPSASKKARSEEKLKDSRLGADGPNESGASDQSSAFMASKRSYDGNDDTLESLLKSNKKTSLNEKIKSRPRKSILKKRSDPLRRSSHHSVTYKNIATVDEPPQELGGHNAKSPVFGKLLENGTRSEVANKLLSSLPNCSQEPSEAPRKRRLHTVDVTDPSQDLIIPSTPPYSDQSLKTGPYEDLRTHCPISQREEMRLLSKGKGDFKVVPLPRTRKLGGKGIRSPECNEVTPVSTGSVSGGSLSSTKQDMDYPKTPLNRRFSLVPSERSSLEEFQSPRNGRRRYSYKKSPLSHLRSICVTSVHSCNIGSIYAIIKSLGGFYVTSDVGLNTTHVICGSERRTLNVLLGISIGCWILDVSWLYESVELLKWAPEEPFELFNFCPGAKISRMLRLSKSDVFKPSLFSNYGRICVSKLNSPPQYVVQDLLQNCGANICSTIRSADLIIGVEKLDSSLQQVHVNWVFDSIQFWDLKKLEDYLI